MTRSPRRLREQVKDTVSELPIHAARLAVMGVGRALLLTDRVRKDYRDVRETGLGPVLGRLKDDAEAITGMVVGKVSGNGKGDEEAKPRAADSEISVGKPGPAAAARRPATPPSPPATPPKPPAASPTRPAATKPTTPKPASKPADKPLTKAAGKPAAAKPVPSKPTPKPTPKPADKPKPAPKAAEKPAAKPKATAAKPTAAKATAAKPKAGGAKAAASAKSAAGLPITGYDEASLASVRGRLRSLDAKQVTELRDYERSHAARADFLRMYENRIAKLKDER